MKKVIQILVILALAMTVVACSGQDEPSVSGTGPSDSQETNVTEGANSREGVSVAGDNDANENVETPVNMDEDLIQLEKVDISNGMNLYEAIETRVASRSFADHEISLDVVTKILWAAHGMTYSEGEQTIHGLDALSSATEVPRYVINPASYTRYINTYYISKEGAYEYVPEDHALLKRSDENLLGEGTTTGKNRQFRILLTIDKDIYNFDDIWGYLAIGSSIQNVNLVANSEDVHVLTEGMFRKNGLASALGLKDSEEQAILLSFGYIE